MEFDTYMLSRVLFALTVMFHYIFPPLSIGLSVQLVVMEGLYLRTKNPVYHAMTRFWVRILAINFAVGVATGIVMEFQFGTNWSRYSRFVGDVFGSALAAEGIFAFFLESGFLAVLVFGWDRVSPRVHFFSTCMVALGSMFSAVWIVVANSWMQTPAGYEIVQTEVGPRAVMTSFWAVIFNPSTVQRLIHVLLGAWVLGAFFVMGVSAWYLLKKRDEEVARRSFDIGLIFGAIAMVAIWISGDSQARKVAFTQPAKSAAMEGNFQSTSGGTPLVIFGVPNPKENRVDYQVAIPGLLSFLVYGDFQTPVAGIDSVPPQDRPPVTIPFNAYHIMVGIASMFLGLVAFALLLWWRGRLYQNRWLLRGFVLAVPLAYISNQAGWVAAEVGRQPWVVYGVLRTSDAFSPRVPAGYVAATIAMFAVLYTFLFGVWLYAITLRIRRGPGPIAPPRESATEGVLTAMTHRQKISPFTPPDVQPKS